MSEHVEVTEQGMGSRLGGAIFGVLIGLVLVAVGTGVLFWNEGRSVSRHKDLEEGAAAVVSADSASVDPAKDGELVHVTGVAETGAPVSDPTFGVETEAIELIRTAEMYQWVEDVRTRKRDKVGGGTETTKTSSYSKEWRANLIDSGRFKKPGGHDNPSQMPYRSERFVAEDVTMGAFRLPPFLVEKIGDAEPLALDSMDSASEGVKDEGRLYDGEVYFGPEPGSPRIGDVRVSFSRVPTGPVSVVARQRGDSFVSYRTDRGGEIDLLERGTVPADEMFQRAQQRNTLLTWGIRGGGFLGLGIGFSMILRPLSVLAGVLPLLGRIVESGTTLIAFILAGIVWTGTVALAWVFYRPLLGIGILVATAALIAFVVMRLRGSKAEAAPEAPSPAGAGSPDTPPPLDEAPPPLS